MAMDIEPTNAVDASIMSTVEMMQSCTLRDSGGNALNSEQAQDVDMDVDKPTCETTHANETNVGSPQHEHVKHKHLHATTLERKAACISQRALNPQHKHLKYLVGVDAKSKAPATISSDKVVKASVQHGRSRLGSRSLPSLKRKRKMESRFAHAVLEAIDEEA
ncbi:hypothetical protein MBLNU13_g09368t2 [Cladosporium sp. NU13]